MEKIYRDQYAHYLNISPKGTTKDWELEGTGVESLSIAYNPQVEQYKTITQRNSDSDFEGYQPQSSVSGKRIYKGDPIFVFLNEARRKGKSIETQILEIELAEGEEGIYPATMYNILIVINEFLGDSATISYDIHFKGDPINGTCSIVDKKPVFTESAD